MRPVFRNQGEDWKGTNMKTAEEFWIHKYDCLPYSTSSKATIELMQEYGDYVKSHMKAKKPPASEYQSCLSVYNDFILTKTGLPSKINGAEGNAMKQIIAYLHRAVNDKSDKGVSFAIKYIFENWDRLEPFLQNQLKLTQINSNLTNILNQLKNGTSKNKSYEQKLAENYRAAGIDTAKF